MLKAQYTAAKAEGSVGESAAGISQTFGDSGAEFQRAQDKIATMQARAGAVDELLQSGNSFTRFCSASSVCSSFSSCSVSWSCCGSMASS